MADYQEYRRRVLRKRWRRRFMAAALLLLLLLVGAIGMLWKSLHREQRPSGHCAGFPYGGAAKEQHGCGQGMVQ